MKLFILIPCFLFPSPSAFALDVEKCPTEIFVSYTELAPMSDRELDGASHSVFYQRNLLKQASRHDYQNLRFTRFDTSRERCRYLTSGQRSHGFNETRLFSRDDGTVILRVSVRIGPEFFWMVHKVDEYSPRNQPRRS